MAPASVVAVVAAVAAAVTGSWQFLSLKAGSWECSLTGAAINQTILNVAWTTSIKVLCEIKK